MLDWKNCMGPKNTKGQLGEEQKCEKTISITRTKENSTWEMTLRTCYKPDKILLYTGK